jgi:ABC-type glycerol-3-phosphate transport system substrate-binding protein
MSKFQLILTAVFGAFIVIGVMTFALFKGGSSVTRVQIVMWGTIPQQVLTEVISQSPVSKDKTFSLMYVEKNPNTFADEFVNALASGVGPDIVFLPQEEILKNSNKFFTIPYATYSERDYVSNFIEAANIFMLPKGVLAIPIAVDPLVMYWNKDIFTDNSLSEPPQFWDQFYNLSQKLTQKDGALNITRSTVALGEYQNITNAKDIIAALFFQAGAPIVTRTGDKLRSSIYEGLELPVAPGAAALTYYTEFSNPSKPYYSWNRSLPDSQSMFVAGDLALYFGRASEFSVIKLKNPNLNFDVTTLPQSRTATKKSTFGRLQSLAIVKNSKNVGAAYKAVSALASGDSAKRFADALRLPSVRRDILSKRPTDLTGPVFYDSALWSKAWIDVDTEKTSVIFRNLIEQVTAGKATLDTSLNQATNQLNNLVQ